MTLVTYLYAKETTLPYQTCYLHSPTFASVCLRILATLGGRCPPLEAGLRALLSSPSPAPAVATPAAPAATLQLLEFLSDSPLGRRLLLESLPQLVLFFREEIDTHSQAMW